MMNFGVGGENTIDPSIHFDGVATTFNNLTISGPSDSTYEENEGMLNRFSPPINFSLVGGAIITDANTNLGANNNLVLNGPSETENTEEYGVLINLNPNLVGVPGLCLF